MFFSRYPLVWQTPQIPPPPVRTRPSGNSAALEWYCRTRLALARTVQAPVAGFHRSAANTGLSRSTSPSTERLSPPVARTLPSASTVRLCWRRPTDIDDVAVTLVAPLTSTTTAVFV